MQVLQDTELDTLLAYDLIYLASPYTKYKFGIDAAAHDVAKVAGRLIGRGIKVFSPIVHSHYVSLATGIDPLDHEFWMKADEAFMKKCDALVIARMAGWEDSYGVNLEIKNFSVAKKPMFGINGVIR